MRGRHGVRPAMLLAGCVAAFLALVGMTLSYYRRQIQAGFDDLTRNNLVAYVESQRLEVLRGLSDIENAVEAAALLLRTSNLDPQGQWIQDYMAALGTSDGGYQVVFVSAQELYAGLSQDVVQEGDQEAVSLLAAGQQVVSEVRYSSRLGGDYYFSIASPVIRAGQFVGAVRSVVNAGVLTRTSQQGYLRQPAYTVVFKPDGQVVPIGKEAVSGVNLFESMAAQGVPAQQIAQLKTQLTQASGQPVSLHASGGAYAFYAVPLGVNDWLLAGAANAVSTSAYSSSILRHAMWVNAALIAFTTLLATAFFHYHWRQYQRQQLAQQHYGLLAQFSDTMLFEYDFARDTMSWSENACRALHLESAVMPNYRRDRLNAAFIHPEDLDKANAVHGAIPPPGQICKAPPVRFLNREGKYIWCDCQYQVARSPRGEPQLMVGKVSDVTSALERERNLTLRAKTDSLTGLLNARAMDEAIGERVAAKADGYLFVLDVDDFKAVNDTLGHAEGSLLLSALAKVMRDSFRPTDLLGRMGGDEFAAFMGGAGEEAARERAELLRRRVEGLRAGGMPLSVSIGVARLAGGMPGGKALMRRADQAMYQAKRAGKNQVCFDSDEGQGEPRPDSAPKG